MTTLLLAVLFVQTEKVDNPEYAAWARFAPGAWVRYEGVAETEGRRQVAEIRTEIIDISPSRVLLEIRTRAHDREQPVERREVPARMYRPLEARVAEGFEEIRVAGQPLLCLWIEERRERNGQATFTKTWYRADVPGGIVQMTRRADGDPPSQTTLSAVEWKTAGR